MGLKIKRHLFYFESHDVLVLIRQKYKMISKEHEARITNKPQYNQEISEKTAAYLPKMT